MLQLFNTLSRKKEDFKPIKHGSVGIYSCGPTVYDFVHIGNLRAYIFVDLLKRYLKYSGYRVRHVMNITDVDDKTIKGSIKKEQSLKEYTETYTDSFLEDLKSLNILLPDEMPKATENIKEMVDLIKRLKQKGYAYDVDGSVYFKISKFKNYGKLAQLDKQLLKRNIAGNIHSEDDYKKDQVNDFVLWKAWQPEDGDVFWETEIGKGRPGWHIECSAMSEKFLGKSFDIHTGGIDLIFPHHTNEIAQSESVTDKKFVNYWLHNAHLKVSGERMGKSLGNFYTLREITAKGWDPLFVRITLIKVNYLKTLNFTFDDLSSAKSIASRFVNFLIDIKLSNNGGTSNKGDENNGIDDKIAEGKKKFIAAMDDNLNISSALAVLFDFMGEVNKIIGTLSSGQKNKITNFLMEVDSVLGFIGVAYDKYQKKLKETLKNKQISSLLDEREREKKLKNFKRADEDREELLRLGIVVTDQKNGFNIKLASIL